MRRQTLNVFRMRMMGATVVPVHVGHAHAEGRDERGDSRLGQHLRRQLLHHRLGGRARAVSADGARLPGRDRHGGARADARARGRAAAHGRRVRRRRFERDRDLPRVRRRRAAWSSSGVEAAGRGLDTSAARRVALEGNAGRAARLAELPAAGRARAGAPGALGLRGSRLSRASGPSILTCVTPAAPRTSPSPTTRRSRAFQLLARLEGVIPALETAHAVAWIDANAGRWKSDEPVLLCVSGRGDKDVAQVAQSRILPE